MRDAQPKESGNIGVGHSIVIGKFMPPTLGHQYLIEHAIAASEHVSVFVAARQIEEAIPLEARATWLRDHFAGRARVVPVPASPLRRSLAVRLKARRDLSQGHFAGGRPSALYASDWHALPLALWLGTRLRLVDRARRAVAISATQVRNDPIAHWRFILPEARYYFREHIMVSESVGRADSFAEEKLFQSPLMAISPTGQSEGQNEDVSLMLWVLRDGDFEDLTMRLRAEGHYRPPTVCLNHMQLREAVASHLHRREQADGAQNVASRTDWRGVVP
jgi:nicotinamide mononucleotide adenylyltransferase